ncbi:hypothetical protein L9F63_015734, partial [Diploptera punctata]
LTLFFHNYNGRMNDIFMLYHMEEFAGQMVHQLSIQHVLLALILDSCSLCLWSNELANEIFSHMNQRTHK